MTDLSTIQKTAAVRRARTTGAAMSMSSVLMVFTDAESARRA